jgi:hypothetical protein
VALWKALQYPDNRFHATNRLNSNFNFVTKKVQLMMASYLESSVRRVRSTW